jgi:hypothetical protein
MVTGKNLIIKTMIIALVSAFSFTSALAANISLSGIDVDQNPENEYSVFVKTDKKANIQVKTNENNKLVILLNSTTPADSLDIIYDDAPDMTNVIVQKKNKNNTLILLEGKNISNAQIYNNDLSTGLIKPVYSDGFSNNKILSTAGIGIGFLLLMMLILKPRNRKYTVSENNNTKRQRKTSRVNTLRNKNLVQSTNIPSISYNVNGSFNSVQKYMTTPADLSVNEQYEEEEIRKAG